MSTQRKLNALLFELQTARSPLAQAKILARAWRTLRELSPTDRKLLARHAGFDGAEDILEGLAKKKSGVAPAMLLQMLSNARGTDASTLRNLLSAFRDPSRRDEAVSRSLDLASSLMANQDPVQEVEEALDELHAVEAVVEETPEEALAALHTVEEEWERGPDETGDSTGRETEASTEIELESPTEPGPTPKKPQPARPPVVDWSRWHTTDEPPRPAPTPRAEKRPLVSTPGARRFGKVAAAAAVEGETSVLARLRALHRALPDLAGSTIVTLGGLIEAFPKGWVRRRALSALIKAGIPDRADDAVTLVASSLDRELDRRWCLGVLAGRGDLWGASLDRANELLSSPSARRRLSASVSQPRSES